MMHIDLVNEATRQLTSRFLPDPTHIKKRIEALIEVRNRVTTPPEMPSNTGIRENISSDVKTVNHIIIWQVTYLSLTGRPLILVLSFRLPGMNYLLHIPMRVLWTWCIIDCGFRNKDIWFSSLSILPRKYMTGHSV